MTLLPVPGIPLPSLCKQRLQQLTNAPKHIIQTPQSKLGGIMSDTAPALPHKPHFGKTLTTASMLPAVQSGDLIEDI
jgi:hypothetical protein